VLADVAGWMCGEQAEQISAELPLRKNYSPLLNARFDSQQSFVLFV
jgi:hypothetical protein